MNKRNNIFYWLSTSLLCFGMLGSGIAQLMQTKDMIDLISHIGYPSYLMYIIGVWKILGVVVILIPGYALVKEWAYAGFFFLMTGALVSHLFMGDVGSAIYGPLFQTVFVVLSWYYRPADRKINYHSQVA
jgi:DoxX-like family